MTSALRSHNQPGLRSTRILWSFVQVGVFNTTDWGLYLWMFSSFIDLKVKGPLGLIMLAVYMEVVCIRVGCYVLDGL